MPIISKDLGYAVIAPGLDETYFSVGKVLGYAVISPDLPPSKPQASIVEYEGAVVTIDNPVTLYPNETYTLSVVTQDGNVQSSRVLNGAGADQTVLHLEQAFTAPAIPNAVWSLSGTDIAPRPFRVLGITEDDKHLFTVNALHHDPTKYARVESGFVFDPEDASNIPRGPLPPPKEIDVVTSPSSAPSTNTINVSWTPSDDPRTSQFQMQANFPNTDPTLWTQVATVGQPFYTIENAPLGKWQFRVRELTPTGAGGQWLYSEIYQFGGEAYGAGEEPTGVVATATGDDIRFTWPKPESDSAIEWYRLRYFPTTSLSADVNPRFGTVVASGVSPSLTVLSLIGTYFAEAVLMSGESIIGEKTIVSRNQGSWREVGRLLDDPPFTTGNRTDVAVFNPYNALMIDDPAKTSGSYELSDYLDLEAVALTRIVGIGGMSSFDWAYNMLFVQNVLALADWFGLGRGEYAGRLFVKYTSDNPASGSAVWTDWIEFSQMDVVARAFKVKAVLEGDMASPMVQQLGLLALRQRNPVGSEQAVIDVVGSDYTLSGDDAGRYIRMSSPNPQVVIVPSDASFSDTPTGSIITIRSEGVGEVSFSGGMGVTINAYRRRLVERGDVAKLIKIGPNEWDLYGDV